MNTTLNELQPKANSWLTPHQVETEFGIPQNTQAVWRCLGRYNFPFTKVGRNVRYRREDLERWLSNRTVNATGRV